ncbi:peptide MFS transporter [Pelomonas sp. SE-A7]|uniref:peptide MFS transporter n=1 Tax=Pelomonas sp. SE-A7 TaxID=3054953 RepID=UPI00259D0848|nr:peptide MFS transporter [Pelomonas sp. SE-A7]MDM4766649.1 peptide MFS transporter [Pelomonas sp. SE-A7]
MKATLASPGRNWFGQPPGLTILFLTETWERFSYYGMSALLIYYMSKQLQFSQADASMIFGLYTGGVYLTPILGGYIADRWMGQRRAVLLGGTLMAIGHFALAWEAQFYTGLLLICLGNGLFLPSLPSQIGDLYGDDDPRRGGAYNVYYVGVNLGGLLAPLVCGTLGEVYGWHWGFGAAGTGMCLGLAIYVLGQRYLPAPRAPSASVRVEEQQPRGKIRLAALLPLLGVGLAVMLFRSAYAQSGNTVALWVDQSVDLRLLGWQLPATWVQALDPLFVFLFTPFLVAHWRRQAQRGREPTQLGKMAMGAAGVALAYLLLAAVAAASSAGDGPVSVAWVLAFFVIYTLAELFILPVGLSLFARLAPPGLGATLIAAWFLAAFAGNLLSGLVGRLWLPLGPAGFFSLLAGLAGAAALALGGLCWRWLPVSPSHKPPASACVPRRPGRPARP